MKVSVWMTAYNHEKYLAQCLDSVLGQKTNFDFEIILGEDCSTDRTREIAIEYKNRFPEKIKLFLPQQNLGMMEMDIATWKLCTGEYIALLNGDDYWTDEYKLQTQADFLDANTDAVMCFHQARVVNETDGSSFETVYLEPGDTMPVESLLLGYNPVMTPTAMIRNVVDPPEWYADMPYGDMTLYFLLAEKGKIKYIDKLMSVYRIHSNGQWQGDSVMNNLLKDIKFYNVLNEKMNFKFDTFIKKIFAQRYFDLTILSINQEKSVESKNYLKELLLSDKDFISKHETEIAELKKIIYEEADVNKFQELLSSAVKWKVN